MDEESLLTDICKAFDKTHGYLQEEAKLNAAAVRAMTPVFYTSGTTGIVTAPNSFAFAKIIGPDMGHNQFLRSISFYIPSLGIGATGIEVNLFVSAADLTGMGFQFQSQLPGVAWRDRINVANAVPKLYQKRTIPLMAGEDLFIYLITGQPFNTQFFVTITVLDFEDSYKELAWAM
jgi:hypothetical protein